MLKQICRKPIQENLIITKADKGRTVVIIDKDVYQQNVKTFEQENHFTKIYKDPKDVSKISTTAVHYIPWHQMLFTSAGRDYVGQILSQMPIQNQKISTTVNI